MTTQSKYRFKVLWSKTYVGIAINKKHHANFEVPLTTFYFWPREDGWKLLKAELDSKPWINENSKIEILNGYTTILNYWLTNVNNKRTIPLKPTITTLSGNVDILGLNIIN